MTINIFSFGGGVQSNAALVLQAQGRIDYDYFVWSNVGNDSEHPDTLAYIREVSIPYAKKHGIEFVTLYPKYKGNIDTLLQRIERSKKYPPIPMYKRGGRPNDRVCTVDYKMRVVDKFIKTLGYGVHSVGIGFTIDEYKRARVPKQEQLKNGIFKIVEYPLIDLKLTRNDCLSIIRSAGLPQAPKSACWFCPFTRRNEWIERKRTDTDLFHNAVSLEQRINKKASEPFFIHPDMITLDSAVPNQLPMFTVEELGCDVYNCWT